jgi:peroxiredoxin/tetratricopeptide (TPR) repeat protein
MKIFFQIAFTIWLLFNFENGFSQQDNAQDTTRRYYQRLANSANEADKALLETKLYALLQSPKEEDWNTATNFFYQLKKTATVDSIQKAIKVKYPMGMSVRNAATDTIYKQKDPVEKEKMYKAWIKKFPPEKFGTDRIQYDYVRNAVAVAYAEAGEVKKAIEYANMTETGAWKGEGWAGPATRLQKAGYLDEAASLFKKAVANSYKYMTTNRADYGAQFAASGYVSYNNSLAEILIEQKKYAEALPYIREAHDSSKTVRANVNSNYAKVLLGLGKEQEAYNMIDEAVKEGQATAEMKEMLKSLYVKVKGSNAGFDEYIASVNKMVAEKIRKDLAKQIVKMPAPMFTLKDVDGNAVSLAAYKGKTVVLDFWATWCGPCKKSFPAMRQAVNRFKEDTTVKFLFIHTWEREEASVATANAKKYVDENKYPFEVLMDLKASETGLNKVVESYKVDAIPTKFVVDKEGYIRFRFTGAAPGEDAAVEEVIAMIELANKAK